jgi:hypothetical protein
VRGEGEASVEYLHAADRNVTITAGTDGNERAGQVQRTKVLKWFQGEDAAIAGYVGVAEIDGEPLDRWLARFFGRYDLGNLEVVATDLARELSALFASSGEKDALLVHLAGFERSTACGCRRSGSSTTPAVSKTKARSIASPIRPRSWRARKFGSGGNSRPCGPIWLQRRPATGRTGSSRA